MEKSYLFCINKTGIELNHAKRCLKRHEDTIKSKIDTDYPVTVRSFSEFFSQKVYNSKELICEQYMDGGKYSNIIPINKEKSAQQNQIKRFNLEEHN